MASHVHFPKHVKRLTGLSLSILVSFAAACAGGPDWTAEERLDEEVEQEEGLELLERLSVDDLNANLTPGIPTVDLNFYITAGRWTTWERMSNAVERAREIYGAVGVQLRVASVVRLDVPESWQVLDADVLDEPTVVEFKESDLYRHQDDIHRRLAPRTESIFRSIMETYDTSLGPAHRALHIVTLDSVPLSYYKRVEDAWELSSTGTSGLSFPPYMFAERIPQDMRGIITMSSTGGRTLAHELGHNLMNVSHEGVGVCPTFATNGDGLMLYGNSVTIPAGPEGRYQVERLHLSPFVYREDAGTRIYNEEFLDGGRYNDPIYGEFSIDPPCGSPDMEMEEPVGPR